MAGQIGDAAGNAIPRIFDDQRDMDLVLIDRDIMAKKAPFPQGLSVIRGDNDQTLVVETLPFQVMNQLADLGIHQAIAPS